MTATQALFLILIALAVVLVLGAAVAWEIREADRARDRIDAANARTGHPAGRYYTGPGR